MGLKAIALLLFGLSVLNVYSQVASEYAIKASFIIKFLDFVEWPDNARSVDSSFVIAVVGKNPLGTELRKYINENPGKSKKIKIIHVKLLENVKDAHVVFVSSNMLPHIKKITQWAEQNAALTISDASGFGEQGMMINFYVERENIRFEINKSSAESAGFKISSLLLNVARIVSDS